MSGKKKTKKTKSASRGCPADNAESIHNAFATSWLVSPNAIMGGGGGEMGDVLNIIFVEISYITTIDLFFWELYKVPNWQTTLFFLAKQKPSRQAACGSSPVKARYKQSSGSLGKLTIWGGDTQKLSLSPGLATACPLSHMKELGPLLRAPRKLLYSFWVCPVEWRTRRKAKSTCFVLIFSLSCGVKNNSRG